MRRLLENGPTDLRCQECGCRESRHSPLTSDGYQECKACDENFVHRFVPPVSSPVTAEKEESGER